MAKPLQQVVCPYCGQTQSPAPRCKNCGGMFDALSVTATEIEMGPWQVRDDQRPFLPGCSYDVLRKRVAAKRIKPDTIIRGPTTRQLWRKAKHTPCVGHLLGNCHACGAQVKPADRICHSCGALFAESTERDELGLRFGTEYAAATGRAELKRAIAKQQADAKAAAERAKQPKPKPPQPSQQEKEVKAAAEAAEGWSWASAPAEPAPDAGGEPREPESAFDKTHSEPRPVTEEDQARAARFATRAVAAAPTSGAVVTAAPAAKRAHPFFGEQPQDTQTPRLIGFGGWAWIAVLGLLFAALFHLYLYWQGLTALQRFGDWSHAVVVPFISIWLVYIHRDELARRDARVCWQGLPILFAGIVGYAWANTPPLSNHMLQGYSMIVALFGLVLFLLGPAMMKILWLPIVYLAFGVTVSASIWQQVAAKLQLLAAQAATVILQIAGAFLDIDATRSGTTIELSFQRDGQWLTGQALNVAEACSGLRMLAAFMALGVLVAYMTPRAWWQRLVLFLLTVPIALAVNVGRVVILGLLFPVNEQMATGDFHKFIGVIMLVPALILYMIAGWVLDRIYVYDEQQQERDARESRAARRVSETEEDVPVASTAMERTGRVIKGALAGGGLCFMVGLTFALAMVSLRPQMVGDDFDQSLALYLLVGDVALLLVLAWLIGKLIEPEIKKPRTMGRLVSLGLVAGVLAVAVLSQQVVLKSTRAVMIKEPIPVVRPLHTIPTKLGSWEMTREDPRLPMDVEETLGTDIYLSRVYEDTAVESGEPGRTVKLHVAYYTGTPDTVPHVPERCFVAGGMQYVDKGAAALRVDGEEIPATIFTYAAPDNPAQQSNVIYFFSANGKYLGSPNMVRALGFDIRDRYSYYCKIELMLPDVSDAQVAARRADAFLAPALPEIVACLPDWDDVQ